MSRGKKQRKLVKIAPQTMGQMTFAGGAAAVAAYAPGSEQVINDTVRHYLGKVAVARVFFYRMESP